jgi:nucleotide-binding universal stress UspA family protein
MTAPTRRPVVVGIDGSDGALAAARWGAVEAHRRGAPLRLQHSHSPVAVVRPDGAQD